jgi:hypothetical protein
MDNDLLDPEELPFTSDEIYRAGCSFLPQVAARKMADALTAAAPGLVSARTERRTAWKTGGIINADELPLHGWVYSDDLLPALSSLSEDLAARVEMLRRRLSVRATYGGAA